MQPLYDLNLQLLEDTHLVRNWRVITRHVNQADPLAPLVRAGKLRFEAPDRLVLHPDVADTTAPATSSMAADESAGSTPALATVHVGTWTLQRDPLLSRPYLDLLLANGATRALITRLRRSKEGDDCDMTLYFQTGMEVQLECA